jgi:cell division protein FtsI (penicillin-binding protein 3)
MKIPGVEGSPMMRRVYPRGTLAAQVLGIVGTEGSGLSGLEYSRNAQLAGHAGQRRVVSDAIGKPISIAETHHENTGTSLALTLDAKITEKGPRAYQGRERRDGDRHGSAHRGDPRNGELASG